MIHQHDQIHMVVTIFTSDKLTSYADDQYTVTKNEAVVIRTDGQLNEALSSLRSYQQHSALWNWELSNREERLYSSTFLGVALSCVCYALLWLANVCFLDQSSSSYDISPISQSPSRIVRSTDGVEYVLGTVARSLKPTVICSKLANILITDMSHKNIYYSEKYYDDEFEYR